MNRISSKKLFMGSVVLIFAGILAVVAASIAVKNGSGQTFVEEGYILSVDETGDEYVIISQSYFSQGSKWNGSNYNTVSYRDADGNTVVCDSDSFLHYNSNAIASLSGGTIVDLDEYLDGKISSYYIASGTSLSYDNGQYTSTANGEELYFDNFIWKNSSQKYLFASPVITVITAGGDKYYLDAGFLEMSYVDDANEIVQMTDGTNAWQLLSDGCTITLDNGTVIDAKSGEVVGGLQEEEENRQTISLGSIAIDAEESIEIGSETSGKAPEFHFTLINGLDGLDGEDGDSGDNGQNGENGENGEDGEDGEDGADAETGAEGTVGVSGAIGTTGAKGEVDLGSQITTAKPTVEAWNWNLNYTNLTFSLYYNLNDDADGVVTTDASSTELFVSPYFYIYDMETGEKVDLTGITASGSNKVSVVNGFASLGSGLPWESELSEQEDASSLATVDGYAEYTISNLELNKVYCLTVIGTYMLSGTDYTTKVMERVFTTNGTGISVSLSNRLNDDNNGSSVNFTVSSDKSGKEDIRINKVTVRYADGGSDVEYQGSDSDSLADKITGLSSNTKYTFTFTTDYTIYQNSTPKGTATDVTTIEWTTLKKTPKLSGLSLVAEDGYLLATAYGAYDADTGKYAYINSGSEDGVDPDNALTGITFKLYEKTDSSIDVSRLKLVKQETTTSDRVYFKVDGSTIANGVNYYLMAEYTYNDGSVDVKMDVMEGNSNKLSYYNAEDDAGYIADLDRSTAKGKAIEYATAKRSSDVSITFSGKGSGLYNNEESEEGISYNTIRGSLLVTLNGTIIRVNTSHKLTMVVTDHQNDTRTYTYDNCGGKKGNIQGSFALSVDLQYLEPDNTYSVTLYAQVYDSNLGTYADEASIGTVILRTESADTVDIGIKNAQNSLVGVGAYFWLGYGSNQEAEANVAPNYYVLDTTGTYKYTSDYLKKVPASYRNLKTIILKLYNDEKLIGICNVEVTDDGSDVINFDPEESPLYQKYYGSSAFGNNATIGVGSSYQYKFMKVDQSGNATSTQLQVSDIEQYASQQFVIEVAGAKDNAGNKIPFNESSLSITFEERPGADPAQMVDSNNIAINFEPLLNENEGAESYLTTGSVVSGKFDADLLDETVVGIQLNLNDAVSSTKKSSNLYGATSITYYGMTESKYNNELNEGDRLDQVRNNRNIILFRFTAKEKTIGKTDVAPTVKLLMYDGNKDEWGTFFATKGYKNCPADSETDWGYDYYYYDSGSNTYIVYINSSAENAFLTRGENYIFAYDAEIAYGETTFSYPSGYYDNQWVSSSRYNRETALKSATISIDKQKPAFYTTLQSSTTETIGTNNSVVGKETWNIRSEDPDNAIVANSLYGYVDTDIKVGGLYSAVGTGSPLYFQGNSYAVKIGFTLSGTEEGGTYTLIYKQNTNQNNQNNQMMAVMTKITDSNEAPVTDTTPIFEAMIKAMKSESGLTVTFSQLDVTGVRYCWAIAYKPNLKGEVAQGTMVYRYYVGPYELESSETSAQISSNANKKLTYKVESLADDATHETMTVSFEPSEDASQDEMRNDFERVAMVEIRAFYRKDGETSLCPVLENTAAENETPQYGEPMVVRSTVNYNTKLRRYAFTFKITDFDSGQYNTCTDITYQYTLYYDGGQAVSFDSGAIASDKYYTLRNMTKKGTTSTPYYLKASSNTTPETAAFEQGAAQAVYQLTSATQSGTKPIVRTYQLNTFSYDANNFFGKLDERTEYLDFSERYDESGTRIKNSYSSLSEGVSELIELSSVTCSVNYTLQDILPYASGFSSASGLGSARITLNVSNYNMLAYTNETTQMPIRCLIYEETEETGTDGRKTKQIKGEPQIYTAVGSTESEGNASISEAGVFVADVSGLVTDTTYRVYFYYENLEGKWTNLTYEGSGGSMQIDSDPPTPGNGYEQVQGTDVYYGTITTQNGVTITGCTLATNYQRTVMTHQTVDKKTVWDSNRTLTASVTTNYNQDDLNVVFVLERREIGTGKWETIMMDKDLNDFYNTNGNGSTNLYDKELYSTLWNANAGSTDAVLCKKANDFETFDSYIGASLYGENQSLTAADGDYTKAVSFTYYPGGALKQGYQYRMKALLFLKNESGQMYRLVSLDKTGKYRYGVASGTWTKYEYSDSNSLFTVTNMSVSNDGADGDNQNNHTLTAMVSRRSWAYVAQAGFIDGYYYIRLAKKTENGWEVVTDPACYGETSVGYPYTSMKICYKAFSAFASESFTLTFQNLNPDTEYRLQFYGITDTDNNNYINIADESGTPFAVDDKTTGQIFETRNGSIQSSTGSYSNNYYSNIYQKYIGIDSVLSLNNYKNNTPTKDFLSSEAYKVMFCTSSSVTTLQDGQRTTLGTRVTVNTDKDGTLTLQFNNTSGVEHITSCKVELYYDSDDGSITNLSSGIIEVTKDPEADSIMDEGRKNGTVTLTIRDPGNDLLNWSKYTDDGMYSLVLYVYDGNSLIKKYDSTFY